MTAEHYNYLWGFWWMLAVEEMKKGNREMEDFYRRNMDYCTERAAECLGLRRIS